MTNIKGKVSGSGGTGEGYTAALNSNNQPGAWVVTFDTAFSEVPVLLATLVNTEFNYTFRTRPRESGFDLEIYAFQNGNYIPAAGNFDFLAKGKTD